MTGITLKVDGMTCEGCARAVTNAVRAARPGATVTVDLKGGTVVVDGVEDGAAAAIGHAIADAGFEVPGAA
jgi:copper chaperone